MTHWSRASCLKRLSKRNGALFDVTSHAFGKAARPIVPSLLVISLGMKAD
jgi:hypothetical protein